MRKELLLVNSILGNIPEVEILLAYYDKHALDKVGSYIWNNFQATSRKEYESLNASLRASTSGYINDYFPKFATTMHMDPRFREIFQELSSYVREAPLPNGNEGKGEVRDYLVASVYEVGAKYGFTQGLLNRFNASVAFDAVTIQTALGRFQELYENFPDLFSGFTDFGVKYLCNPAYKDLIDKLNSELESMDQARYWG